MRIEDRIYTGLKLFSRVSAYRNFTVMRIEDRIYTGLKHLLPIVLFPLGYMRIEDRIYTGLKLSLPTFLLETGGYEN